MRVPVNLASRPADAVRSLRFLAIGAGVLAVLLAGVALRSELRSREEFRALVDRSSQLQGEIRQLSAAQQELESYLETPQVERIRNRSALLNSLIRQKSLSWTRMFQDLETTLPAGARILSIAPELDDQQQPVLRLAVAARSVTSLVDFIKRMEDSDEFANPVVAGQSFPQEGDPTGEIELTLTTHYAQGELPVPTAEALKKAALAADADEPVEEDSEIDPDAVAVEPGREARR